MIDEPYLPHWVQEGIKWLEELIMNDDPGDLKSVGKILIPFWCEVCHVKVGIRAELYQAGIADLLEDAPTVCPACHNEVRWLSEDEAKERMNVKSYHPIQPEN